MESVSCKWLLLSFFLFSWAHSALCAVDGVKGGKVRGVSLGNWLVVEGWMKPSLFDGIPNPDMLDGARVQFQSLSSLKYVSAKNGGGSVVSVDQNLGDTWETFRLWRVSQSDYQFRTSKGQFLSCTGQGASVTATSGSPSLRETFTVERASNGRVRIKHSSGVYLQASSGNELKANYAGIPGFDDGNAAIFNMTFGEKMQGEYQLCTGHGREKAKKVLTEHRNTYITREDFRNLSTLGINTVRIPVGWWITKDPNPPAPYVGGSLAALDNAFKWAQEFGIKCIINLHAAPGSQNGKDHSSSRDGSVDWLKADNIQQTLDVIEFLAARYGSHPALLGIDLLNNPLSPEIPFDTLQKYYKEGYDIVRKHSSTAYVILCQLDGPEKPADLYKANIGKSKVVVDLHYFHVLQSFEKISPQENIEYLYNIRKTEMDSLNAANGPLVFIGEWVNEFGKGGHTQKEYQEYGSAQLDVYGSASFGWSYWSLKNVNDHWSFNWNIDNNYLQLGARKTAGNDPVPLRTPCSANEI
ncbi:hypothetical protein MKW94_015870 [Papaver nudicaule]|uniref:Mannan endo-1,4-beta-mannosidase n=1 Tax=Papaver nudicaule TaxID=74823 RepID=A0AA41SBN9_PAPNU|nr:hypothetical protein [Papaver nudicaule]